MCVLYHICTDPAIKCDDEKANVGKIALLFHALQWKKHDFPLVQWEVIDFNLIKQKDFSTNN